jgi:death-on-curing protein
VVELLRKSELIEIHDLILETTGIGLPGQAGDKDLEGMLARVENRIHYKLSDDLLHIASFLAVAIATGHCFNDGNKRTAFVAMDSFLRSNGVAIDMDQDLIVQMMIDAASGQLGHEALAARIAEYLYEQFDQAGNDDAPEHRP